VRSVPAPWNGLYASLALVILVVAAYYPVHSHPFFGIDDPAYLTSNSVVLGPLTWRTIVWAFTHNYCLNYDPLTLLAHSLDVRMFHVNPAGHHDANVVLHALDAVLLFWVLKRSTGYLGRSFMVAALFALHPISVENVAWIAELKTLLSAAFFFLALGAYHWYAERPDRRRMAVVALFYTLGLLSKPQVITLPFVLLLWDYWPLRRMFPAGIAAQSGTTGVQPGVPGNFGSLFKEKRALFVIAAADAVVTMIFEHKATPDTWPYSFSIRLGNAVLSYSRYLGKAFWPLHLSYLYPHPGYSLRWGLVWASLALLTLITAVVVAEKRRRYLLVGWLWFLGTMVPMIGLVQIDFPAFADRWAYTGLIGIFVMLCWSAAEWASGNRSRTLELQVASVLLIIALGLLTRRQVGYWRDDLTVWSHSLEVNQRNWLADRMVGDFLETRGLHDEALQHLYRAAEDRPGDRYVNLDIAFAEHRRRNLPVAIRYYEKVLAVSTDPDTNAQAWANLGHIYADLGDTAHARSCYAEALRIRSTPPLGGPHYVIHWRGKWWNDLPPYLRERWQEYKANDVQ
jgi:hypothetical protein